MNDRHPPLLPVDAPRALALARDVLDTEARAIATLGTKLGTAFVAAVGMVLNCRGRVVVSGIGKSGHIARKLAATLASTGTPAFFVHPAEASHGDLGMITPDDVVITLSNSGETDELVMLAPHLRARGRTSSPSPATSSPRSRSAADVHLDAAVDAEACPLGLAPTASTTAALALGDAIAIAVLDARGFSAEDFARSHPGGSLGRRLLTRVEDVMRSGSAVPTVGTSATLAEAVIEMSGKGMGMTAVVGGDGARRRHLHRRRPAPRDRARRRLPRRAGRRPDDPRAAADRARAPRDRLRGDDGARTQGHPVARRRRPGRLVGALHLHDLFRARVI